MRTDHQKVRETGKGVPTWKQWKNIQGSCVTVT